MFVKWKGHSDTRFDVLPTVEREAAKKATEDLGFQIYGPNVVKPFVFKKGEAQEVDDAFGNMLLRRGDFEEATAPAPKPTPAPAAAPTPAPAPAKDAAKK